MPRTQIGSTGSGTFTTGSTTNQLIVECLGGGANALNGSTPSAGGAGGGAYTKKTITVSPSTGYSYFVGDHDQDTWFISSATILAVKGVANTNNNHGTGGDAASCIGDISYSGGAGGDAYSNSGGGGGGGGSGAGTGAGGGNGTNGILLGGGTGGTAPAGDGGNGGNGGNTSGGGGGENGTAGGSYAGGGGGRGPSGTCGSGGIGAIFVTEQTISPSFMLILDW